MREFPLFLCGRQFLFPPLTLRKNADRARLQPGCRVIEQFRQGRKGSGRDRRSRLIRKGFDANIADPRRKISSLNRGPQKSALLTNTFDQNSLSQPSGSTGGDDKAWKARTGPKVNDLPIIRQEWHKLN
jgi:hypothetical protein